MKEILSCLTFMLAGLAVGFAAAIYVRDSHSTTVHVETEIVYPDKNITDENTTKKMRVYSI